MLIFSLPMKSRERLARAITDIFATQSGLFMTSLTFGHKLTVLTVVLLGSQTSIFNKRDYKSTEKLLSVYCFIFMFHLCRQSRQCFLVKHSKETKG